MNANQILMLAGAMGIDTLERMNRQNQEAKKRHWHQIGSKCSHCKGLCDPQEVFCSDKCRGEYVK